MWGLGRSGGAAARMGLTLDSETWRVYTLD
jgi:hypothetical protein